MHRRVATGRGGAALVGARLVFRVAATLLGCREQSLDCLDLAAAVPKTPVAFYDDVHFTEAGAQIVADAMTRMCSVIR